MDALLRVAPMMGLTDRHERRFLRLFSRAALLYTEMITARAVRFGKQEVLLGFSPDEQPVALQLGGGCPEDLARAAVAGAAFGYREINLNLGCPSARVQDGSFGACLMADPPRVRACLHALAENAPGLPITLKCRIGIDKQDSYAFFRGFVDALDGAPCAAWIVHARAAILGGLSPKQNLKIPRLRYDYVHRLKRERPDLHIVINGGICAVAAAKEHLRHVDGVMIGREIYRNPWFLAQLDRSLQGTDIPLPDRHELLQSYLPYVEQQLRLGVRLARISRHMLNLFHGCPGGKNFRRHISAHAHEAGAGVEVLRTAAELIERATPPLLPNPKPRCQDEPAPCISNRMVLQASR